MAKKRKAAVIPPKGRNNANLGIDKPSDAYMAMVPNWELTDALMTGTTGMREQSIRYLPKEPKEKDDAYNMRLERSVLFPGFKKALRNLTGKAFANSVQFKDASEQWLDWFDNVDLAGANMQQFCERVFLSGLQYGHVGIQAEYPTLPQGATLADERQVLQARPYLVMRCAKEIIGWRTMLVNNYEKLTRVRLQEAATDYDETWDDDGEKMQIRVLEPGKFQVYTKNDAGDWVLDNEGVVSIKDKVPMVAAYFDQHYRTFQTQVPMLDLAWTNVAHWQSYSDQRNILRVARVPMVLVTGATQEELGGEMTIGPNRFIALRNPSARMAFVEHGGAAITAGRQDTIDLEERMYLQAAEPLMSRPGSETATGRALDAREATSPLAVWVANFERSMNQAFELMAEYGGADAAPVLQMTRDFGILGETSDLDALLKMRATGEISRETFLNEMKRRGVLSERFDIEEDEAKLEEEPPPKSMVPLEEREKPDDEDNPMPDDGGA